MLCVRGHRSEDPHLHQWKFSRIPQQTIHFDVAQTVSEKGATFSVIQIIVVLTGLYALYCLNILQFAITLLGSVDQIACN